MTREEFEARCRLAEKFFEAMRAGDHVAAMCVVLLEGAMNDRRLAAEARARPPSPTK